MSNTNTFFGGGTSYEPRIEQNELDIVSNTTAINDKPNDNLLINGDFSIWQRGTSFTGYEYGCDRWIGASANVTRNYLAHTGFILRASKSTGDSALIAQGVELDIADNNCLISPLQAQGTYTISVTVDTTNRVRPHIIYRNSIAGSPSDATNTVFEWKGSGERGLQTLSWTFTLDHNPTATMRCLVVSLQGELAATEVFFHNAKLELGSAATPFMPDTQQENLAKCQRYYINSVGNIRALPTNLSTAQTTRQVSVYFPVTMRTIPAVTVIAGVGNTHGVAWESISGFLADCTAVDVNSNASINGYTANAEL